MPGCSGLDPTGTAAGGHWRSCDRRVGTDRKLSATLGCAPADWRGAACTDAAPQLGRLGRAYFKGDSTRIAKGILHAQRDDRHLHCAHVANEPTHDVIGLGNPIERGLATRAGAMAAGRPRSFRWRSICWITSALGDGGNDPQRPLLAKRTGGHIQSKYPLQEPRPAPVRRLSLCLIPFHALLAWRRGDRLRRYCAAPNSPHSAPGGRAAGALTPPASPTVPEVRV